MLSIEELIENSTKRYILGKLIHNKQLRYSELMPKDVDNVLFNYHLQHLVKLGVLDKNESDYSLSLEGQKLTCNITDTGLYFPKFTCKYKLYVIKDDKILLQHRTRSLWDGDVTGLSSKLMYGENIEERARLRIKEKVGITSDMRWLGTLRTLTFDKNNDLIDDTIYFICICTEYTGELHITDDNGDKLQWYSFDDAIILEEKNKTSGERSIEILRQLQQKNYTPFAFEEKVFFKTT